MSTTRTSPRPNRYAGACHTCRGWIAAESGTIVKVNGRWAVAHIGACPETPAPAPERPARPARPSLPDVAAGRYAIADPTGRQDLRFYRVDRPTEGRWAGFTFVKAVIGGQPDYPVRDRAAVADILAAIAADPEAGPRFGRELGKCYACGRHLTDEVSRAAGIGPDCAGRR